MSSCYTTLMEHSQILDRTAFNDEIIEVGEPARQQSNGPAPIHETKRALVPERSLSDVIAEQERELAENKNKAIKQCLDRIKAIDIERSELVLDLRRFGYSTPAERVFDSFERQHIGDGTQAATPKRRGRPAKQTAEPDDIDKRQAAREAKLAAAAAKKVTGAGRTKDADKACKLCSEEHGEKLALGHSGRSHRWVPKFEKKAFTKPMLKKLKEGVKPKDLV